MSARQIIEAGGKTDAYLSIVLDEASRLRVQRLAVHPQVYGDHVTVAYQPTESQLKQLRPHVGKWFKFEATAIAQDSKGQALRVTGTPSINAHPHVTVSCVEGVEPVYSNKLLEKERGQPKVVRLAGRLEESRVGEVGESELTPRASGFFGGTDARGDWVIQSTFDVRAVDHSELGVRRDRWRWSPRVPDMVMWTDDAVPPGPKAHVAEFLKEKAGADIHRHRGLDSYNTWSDLVAGRQTNEALKISVPPFAQSSFFHDHGAAEEFWAMKSRPVTRAGEMIEFYFGGKPVATAQVSRVEEPGQSACGHSGKFGNKWKVHWKDASFCKVGAARAVIESELGYRAYNNEPIHFGDGSNDWTGYWLDPQGKFHEIEAMQHDEWAAEHTGIMATHGHTGVAELLERGWVRCVAETNGDSSRVLHVSSDKWNKVQRRVAELAAIEHSATLSKDGAKEPLYVPPVMESARAIIERAAAQPYPDSKVQQLVYHGTGHKFRRFRRGTQGIIWFSSNRDKIISRDAGAQGHGYIVSAYVNIQHPADWPEYNKLLLAQFLGEGLDGAVLRDGLQGGFDCFVFDPEQVRIVNVEQL